MRTMVRHDREVGVESWRMAGGRRSACRAAAPRRSRPAGCPPTRLSGIAAHVLNSRVMTGRRFRDMADVKTWNDEMGARYDLDRFHAHPSPFVRLVQSRPLPRTFGLLAP